MAQRGRKSAASLSVIAGTIDGRPKSPDCLTKGQTEVWERTVASEASDFFRTAAQQQLLIEYCRHVVSARNLSAAVSAQEGLPAAEAMTLEDFDRLLKMRDRENRAITSLATKMRLTNQSRYETKSAATAAKSSEVRKPWQAVG